MTDKEKLNKAISLLREWMYELAPLEACDPSKWTTESIVRDYSRLSGNTIYFLENDLGYNLEED